jgi:uracil-DNA glycosylase
MNDAVDRDLDRFIGRLSGLRLPNTTNPYDRTREGRRRLSNLRCYLSHFRPPHQCGVLLVAEAYGYRGGRVTGVPLTSESIIESHPHFTRCFPVLSTSYEPCHEPGAQRTETTASIVWRLFADLGLDPPPCCWNIVPVHPYAKDGGPWSNRPPTASEIAIGSAFTHDLVRLLKPDHVIAVGRCADRGLTRAGIDHAIVRHPSQGGATQFRTQLALILGPSPSSLVPRWEKDVQNWRPQKI